MKPIYWMVPAVAVVVLGAVWLSHRAQTRASGSAAAPVQGQQAGHANSAASPSTQPQESSSPDVAELPGAVQPGAGQSNAGQPGANLDSSLAGSPASDSIGRNPTNGMIFAGTGKYQLYRQGDITWRLDTDTGWACILFATDAQWSKPRVFGHGCASAQTVSR